MNSIARTVRCISLIANVVKWSECPVGRQREGVIKRRRKRMKDFNTTAIVKIDPRQDETYLALKSQIGDLCRCINAAVVDSPTAVMNLTKDVNIGRGLLTAVDKQRTADKAKILEYGRAIDGYYKALSDPLTALVDNRTGIAAQKILKFNNEQREKQRKAEEEQREKQRLIDAENARKAREATELQAMIDEENEKLRAQQTIDAEGTIVGPDLIEPEPEPEYIPPAPIAPVDEPVGKVVNDFGSATEKMVARVEVIDFATLPDQWKLPNDKALNAAVKAGVRDIPGTRIWMEPEIQFRAKGGR